MQEEIERGFAGIHLNKVDGPTRTEGDGMENINNDEYKNITQLGIVDIKNTERLRDKFIYYPEDFKVSFTKPPQITGKIIQLKPAPIVFRAPKCNDQIYNLQGKEPKFVPYEPYKGAVKPMVPNEKLFRRVKSKKTSTSSVSSLKVQDEAQDKMSIQVETISEKSNVEGPVVESISLKKDNIEIELERLQKENQQLENQLKFQIQVNGDLKNLLVASVGEDMETRVHVLTEDKLHLARALLSSAQKLNTHQEQTEWLAGQCEVWRSKFLASSIMVEELAKWKALLTRRVQDLQDMTKHLLEERLKVREYLISTYKDLSVLCDNFDVTSLRSGVHNLNSSNILDLSEMNMQLSAIVRLQLLGNGIVSSSPVEPSSLGSHLTITETLATELLCHPVPELENADVAYSAVMGAALSSTTHVFSPACCGHCTGEIKTI